MGPALGSCLAVAFYRFIKMLEFETANPGQDFNDKEAEVFEPDEVPARAADVSRPVVGVVTSPTGEPMTTAAYSPSRVDGAASSERLSTVQSSQSALPTQSTHPTHFSQSDQLYTHEFEPKPTDSYDAATGIEEGTMGGNYKL